MRAGKSGTRTISRFLTATECDVGDGTHDAADGIEAPQDIDVVAVGFHVLSGDQAGRYAVTVSRNWRLTVGWEGRDAIDVDLEDYHG